MRSEPQSYVILSAITRCLAKSSVYSRPGDMVVDYNGQGRNDLDQSIFKTKSVTLY